MILHAVSHSFEEMLACAQLIAFGVLERHPGLRVVFLESSGGWGPFWLERLDEQAESFGGFCPDMKLRPSEYFARQCAISFEVDERTLPALAPFVGAERIVWGSDYPHHDATFPGAVEAIRATVAPCPTAVQARVLGLNARRLYGLPSRREAVEGVVDDYFAAVTAQDVDLLRSLFAPDASFDVDGEVRAGHEAILDYYTERTFTFRGLPASAGADRGGRVVGDGGHRCPHRRCRQHGARRRSRYETGRSGRSRCAGSPTPSGRPARAEPRVGTLDSKGSVVSRRTSAVPHRRTVCLSRARDRRRRSTHVPEPTLPPGCTVNAQRLNVLRS